MISKKVATSLILGSILISFVSLKCFSFFSKREEILEETHEIKEYPFTKGTLTIKNECGDVFVESWDKDLIQIETIKKASKKLIDDIVIHLEVEDKSTFIETRFPRSYYFWKPSGNKSVDFIIKIPKIVKEVKINLVAGSTTIKNVDSIINIEASAGNIDLTNIASDTTATLHAGTITLTQKAFLGSPSIFLHTRAGAIKLNLDPSISTRIKAEIQAGTIHSQFQELKPTSHFPYVRSWLEGTILSGNSSIILKVEAGNISINKHDFK